MKMVEFSLVDTGLKVEELWLMILKLFFCTMYDGVHGDILKVDDEGQSIVFENRTIFCRERTP